MSAPPDSEQIAAWARLRGVPYFKYPDELWFRAWEPFWVLISPLHYFNAVRFHHGDTQVILVEPWFCEDGFEPQQRSLFAFVSHYGLKYRAAARIGASSLTRVAFLGENKPQEQSTGDIEWDDLAITYAPSHLDAVRAITPSLRKLLREWSFRGHLEFKHGGLLLHIEDAQPIPSDCERVLNWIPKVLEKALKEQP